MLALVTGATGGIGQAVARALTEDGYKVALVARSTDRLKALAEELGGVAYPADLTDQAEEVAARVLADHGSVNLLFNNAGRLERGTLDLDAAAFDRMVSLNLRAPFLLMRALAPSMKPGARILNLSSRSGKVGFPGAGLYAASKFGLNGLNEAVYRSLSERGIRVTALCPSWVDTPMADVGGCRLRPEERLQPQDIVKTVRWLLSLSPSACVKEVVLECAGNIH